MPSVLLSLPELFTAYKRWVSQNPQLASDCESSAKWISYFLVSKINNSHVVSELVYCASNLLVLLNDRIICGTRQLEFSSEGNKLKLWLTVIEYCEVVFELSAKKIWGTAGKWLIVFCIQVFKCISRLILIFKYNEDIIQTPPIPTLERNKLMKTHPHASVADIAQAQMNSVTFKLRSSGRVIRRVEGAPPISLRNWKPIYQDHISDNEQTIEQALARQLLVAETIYTMKPVAHLASMACFGDKSWKPWVLSLLMDLISLRLYTSCTNTQMNSLTPKQKLQLSKRRVALVMYLIRSPFYEQYSKNKLNAFLISLSKNVPLAKLICNPLIQYLPFWQSNYFYMWST